MVAGTKMVAEKEVSLSLRNEMKKVIKEEREKVIKLLITIIIKKNMIMEES